MIMMHYSVNINTRMALGISFCSNSNHLISIIPRTASNFTHLLSCGTIEAMKIVHHHANDRFDWLISEYHLEIIEDVDSDYERQQFFIIRYSICACL